MKKMVNYYPAKAVGVAFWTTGWDPAQIAADFARIAALGANTVRIFVHPAAMESATSRWPIPDPDILVRVEQVVDIARDHGLRVHLTLFDLYPQAFIDIPGSKTWAKSVLAWAGGYESIACVELHNEIPPDNPTVMGWVKVMLPYIRRVGGHPVTVSYTSTNAEDTTDKIVARFTLLVDQVWPLVDFLDFHWYGPASSADTIFGRIKAACNGKPLYIGETGKSTYGLLGPTGQPLTLAQAEIEQAHYATYTGAAAKNNGLDPPGWWMLNDTGAASREGRYGAFRIDESAKPVAGALAAIYA